MKTLRDEIDVFFNRPGSGDIFIHVDPYHHYRPVPQNGIMLCNEGIPKDKFSEFIHQNVTDATRCSYVPESQLLWFHFPKINEILAPEPATFDTIYIDKVLIPYIAENKIKPVCQLSLRSAYFMSKYGDPNENPLSDESMQCTPLFHDFISIQQKREKRYLNNPELNTPLVVAQTDHGYLIFSNNRIGQEGLRQFSQHIVDHYFDPHLEIGSLSFYEYPYENSDLAPLVPFIDKSYTDGFFCNHYQFTPEVYTPYSELPDGFIGQLEPIIQSELKPTSEDFINFAEFLQGWSKTQTFISKPNMDIYWLLGIKETGYINIHAQPFSFDLAFDKLVKKWKQVAQTNPSREQNIHPAESLKRAIRELADHYLKDEFDVRGHWALVRMLDDPAEKIVIRETELNQAEKDVLSDRHTLYMPCDTKKGFPETYAKLNDNKQNIHLSPNPPPGKVYRIENGTAVPCESSEPQKIILKKNVSNHHL